jgi:hypothetical protein
MKKLTFLFGAFIMLASVSSCKKDYTCTCSYNVGGVSGSQSFTFTNVTKSQATTDCNNENAAVTGSGVTCSLN